MAEDDEIDVLGDFNLDNFLSKTNSGIYENTPLVSQNSELLNCDYTIHPQWLLDKPSTNPDCWYDNNSVLSSELSSKPNSELDNNDGESLVHVSTQNAITDESGWTENEKHLLERGIEIFGKSHVRLSQFIGSRTSAEVKYYFKNFYTDAQPAYTTFNTGIVEELNIVNNLVSDVLDETQIPASIEEVIAAVSTAKPTAVSIKNSRKKSYSTSSIEEIAFNDNIPSGHSVLKQNNFRSQNLDKKKAKVRKAVKFKIKTELKFPMKNGIKQKTVKICNKVGKVEITTGKGLSVPICEGEQVVKIRKDDSDNSDIEIDVEDSFEINPENKVINKKDKEQEPTSIMISKEEEKSEKLAEVSSAKQKLYIDLTILSEILVKELTCLEEPKSEIKINENFISELEKVIHSEFFEGRPTKTPLRYLKIRNHIMNCWSTAKPSYVTKTSIRQGLKNCGDVNCISRVHCYLEQIGAINFGCSQTRYIRPLYEVFQALAPTIREKPGKDNTKSQLSRPSIELVSRPRIKRRFANDGEGGCTLTHDEKGEVINTTIVKEEPVVKPKSYVKKPTIRLIYCRPFPDERPQKYKVKLNLTTLLLMDFHAHTSLTEVMGLVAGTWNPSAKILHISHYEPCKNIASSATHCDMCPISQSTAAELIHNKGLDVLGWFHSHPTFAPEPSQQDLETQQDVQMWIGAKTPCLGVILSPFSSHGALIASPFRCMVVDKKQHFEDQFVPYKFRVDIITNAEEIESFFEEIQKVYRNSLNSKDSNVDFSQCYFQDSSISYLEKYITSVRMHLAKCGTLNKSMCDYIIDTINSICSK